ncbi:MAG: DALR domain-containing protein, partial [Candidatus Paceibacterota bacterium]
PTPLDNMRVFAEPYIASFKSDNVTFGNLPPTNYTRASDYIRQQIALIRTLEEKGYAYQISDGLYFDISKFPAYGRLGNVDVKKMKAGARVEVNPEKRHPADFALWKLSAFGFESRWGRGFPGWHIECTAMAFATLGKQIDIHTGGEDLVHTHHNGEIAQAECTTGKKYVNYWLHNAFVTIDKAKIAKSAGNSIRLKQLADRGFSALDYRYWLLQSHYRTTANFTWEALAASKVALGRLRRLIYEELAGVRSGYINTEYEEKFVAALSDDLDTPKAIAVLWDLAKDKSVDNKDKLATIHLFDSLLSLGLSKDPEEGRAELGVVEEEDLSSEVTEMLTRREVARQAKDFILSDRLRDELRLKGFEVKDTAEGQQLMREK